MGSFGTTASVDFTFVCSQGGEYKFNFSNIASAEDKLVIFDYEVDYYIFGMPQMLFLTFIVVGTCIAAVAVYILLSKHPWRPDLCNISSADMLFPMSKAFPTGPKLIDQIQVPSLSL